MKWWVEEDAHTWQLFYGDGFGYNHPCQVIKAPKVSKEYAEYWPTPDQTRFILAALNAMEEKKK